MRISVRGLDDGFTYPCSKSDVREAFGDVLRSASFGLTSDHSFARKDETKGIPGRVLLTLGVSTTPLYPDETATPRASLYVYRVRRENWSDDLHWQVREAMRDRLRPWVDEMKARPEIAWGNHEETLIELREGVLHVHVHRSRRYL